jgi:hypothetical protein
MNQLRPDLAICATHQSPTTERQNALGLDGLKGDLEVAWIADWPKRPRLRGELIRTLAPIERGGERS